MTDDLAKVLKELHGIVNNFRIRGSGVAGNLATGYTVKPGSSQMSSGSGGGVTPTGACCVDGDCSIQTESDCIDLGGVYQGTSTSCDPNPCVCECFPSQIIFTFTFDFNIAADCPSPTCDAFTGSAIITKTYTRVEGEPSEDGQFKVNSDCTIDIFDSSNFFIIPTDIQSQLGCTVSIGNSSMSLTFGGHFGSTSGIGNALVICDGKCGLDTGDILFPAIDWCEPGMYTSTKEQTVGCALYTATLTLEVS